MTRIVIAVAFLVALLASGAGAQNPLQLPAATTSQVPLTGAYGALNVPAKAAGATYADPTTGVTVYKLTSSVFPVASAVGFAHDYAEGGHEVSLPHTGTTRTVLARDRATFSYWLIDFTPGSGVSNQRVLPANLAPWVDIAFTFSSNPATPQYAYVAVRNGVTGVTIKRFDFRNGVMAEAPGNGWPRNDGTLDCGNNPNVAPGNDCAIWLHQSADDDFFVWMRTTPDVVVGYQPSTGTLKSRTVTGMNDPHVDRAGRYVSITMSGTNGLSVWDWLTDAITWTKPGDFGTPAGVGNIPYAHYAALSRRMLGINYNQSFPGPYWQADPSVPNSNVILSGGGAPGDPEHVSGNWVQSSVPPDDQWALANMYGAVSPPAGPAWLGPGAMTFVTANGQRRILGHAYNSESVDLTRIAYAKPSPDGKYVLFTSNMNVSGGRSDLFLAEVPVLVTQSPAAPTGLSGGPKARQALTVTIAGTGSGTVAGAGIACPGDCLQRFSSAQVVTLTAATTQGSTFAGWSGSCTGTGSCVVTMSAARNVTATFTFAGWSLAWDDNATDETGFQLERRTPCTSGTFALLTSPAANVQAFTDNTAQIGVPYEYRIRAVNTGNAPPNDVSAYSNLVCTP